MKLTDWQIEVAAAATDSHEPACVSAALKSFFSLFTDQTRVVHAELNLFPYEQHPQRLVVIPSTHTATLVSLLTELLKGAYSHEQTAPVRIGCTKVLLIRINPAPALFEHLVQIYHKLQVGRATELSSLCPSLEKITKETKPVTLTCSAFRAAIEESTFPSGAAEIQEVLFRRPDILHLTRGYIRQIRKFEQAKRRVSPMTPLYGDCEPALRLLFGAFASGDISSTALINTIEAIAQHSSDRSTDMQGWGELAEQLHTWTTDIDRSRQSLGLLPNACDTLSHYLNGRKILIIEDQLNEQSWHMALPVLFGVKGILPVRQQLGGIAPEPLLHHATDVTDALTRYGDKLREYDVILLDLFSSESRLNRSHQSKGALLSTIGPSLGRLVEQIAELAGVAKVLGEIDRVVMTAFPQILVFSHDSSGITVRTVFHEYGAADYFLKNAGGEPQKAEFYATFRQCIIDALKRTCIHVTGHAHVQLPLSHFNTWLYQFDPIDRPLVLSLMKHFRYYSANSILQLFDGYLGPVLKYNKSYRRKGVAVSLFDTTETTAQTCWFSYLGRANKSGPATLALLSKSSWFNSVSECATAIPLVNKQQKPKLMPSFCSYDDLLSQISISVVGDRNGTVQLVFVDDVIGSGGQLSEYLFKFANEHMSEAIYDTARKDSNEPQLVWKKCQEMWQRYVCAFRDPLTHGFQVHTLMAVGVRNDKLKQMLNLNAWPEGKQLRSQLRIPISDVPPLNEQTGKYDSNKLAVSNPEHHFTVNLHICDLREPYNDICAKKGLSVELVEHMLWKYTLITNPRAKEYPCEFEPFGWEKCGALFATYANVPGNTLPIIWGSGGIRPWSSLFHRFFNPWHDGGKGFTPECNKDHDNCIFEIARGCQRTFDV